MPTYVRKPAGILRCLLLGGLILMAALFFGQVLGGYYLGYLEKGAEGLPGTAPQQTKVSAGVITKVLRLTPATYYTVLAGSFPEREAALQLGYALADQGVPAVITEETNYLVLIGFLNNKEKLTPFADSLHIEGQKAQVIERQMNAVSFKFRADDAYAAEVVAPFLGDLNVSLQKGLLLYSALDAAEGLPEPAAAKFTVLAAELEELAQSGQAVAEREESVLYKQDLSALAKRCGSWATAIRGWSGDPRRVAMLISQQQALALLEDYHRLMAKTN